MKEKEKEQPRPNEKDSRGSGGKLDWSKAKSKEDAKKEKEAKEREKQEKENEKVKTEKHKTEGPTTKVCTFHSSSYMRGLTIELELREVLNVNLQLTSFRILKKIASP